MIKRFALILTICTAFVSTASAQSNQFGVGLILGEPIAFNAKLWVSSASALSFSLGWNNAWGRRGSDNCYYRDERCYNRTRHGLSREYCDLQWRCDDRYYYRHDGNSVHLSFDYLIHNFSVFNTSEKLSIFYGPGLMANFGDYYYRRDNRYVDYRFGVRFPLGFSWIHQSEHLNIFFELAPVLVFSPYPELTLNGGLGARYFF
ncbi:hypothetical protein QA601_11575 [Chitinispirillales bacterium ANBcel5]|uniref:hypothetical protein n=1 Tax=Cellulosispirillum alkaliphilum TaxID=3039283 RepID=UPI002A51F8CE|nr:hypothetical protein [Chitinispirillales bacterium ANBcel5]